MKRTGFARACPFDPETGERRFSTFKRQTEPKLARAKPLAQRSKKQRRGPARDPKYLRFVRSQPCCVCGKQSGIIAHHMVEGDGDDRRGLSQKVSDYKTIPFCEGTNVCDSHHKQFHRRLRDFAGWSNERRRVFQEEEIARLQSIWHDLTELGVMQDPERKAI
jgi:hypothetical protein